MTDDGRPADALLAALQERAKELNCLYEVEELLNRADNGHLRLEVGDTGHGIPVDQKPRIFLPFFTTKDVDQGTGLGLSVVHGIVSAHGGTIDVKSNVGEGTIFVVTLPTHGPAELR